MVNVKLLFLCNIIIIIGNVTIIIIIMQGLLCCRPQQVHVFNPLNNAIGLCLHSLIKNALFSTICRMLHCNPCQREL